MKFPGKSAWLGLSIVVIALDQFTKWLVAMHMHVFQTITVLPVFNIALLHNTGAAFSMLAGQPGWQRWFFLVLAFGISGVITVWLYRMPKDGDNLVAASLTLVVGGALGNAWDRLVTGYVVDFLQFHWASWYFPAFNVADSAITIGAAILILPAIIWPRLRVVK